MLPTTKTKAKTDLGSQIVLMHGRPKIGKSTWASKIPNAVFIPTEPGLGSLEVYKACEGSCISSWTEFLAICAEIKKGDHPFKAIIIDTVDRLYLLCAQYICEKKGVEHESDLEYGKGSALVNREFSRVLTALASLGYGLFLLSHTQEREIETRAGKVMKFVPALPNKAREALLGWVDVICYADLEISRDETTQAVTYNRVLRTKPGATYEAGDRTGRLPETLPLDFVEFAKAFTTGGAPLAGIDAKADAALTAAKAAMAKRAQEKAGKEVAA